MVAEKALRGSGHEVFSAGDGESGLQPVKEKRPDLVIPDLMMPRMHGFTVCQAVRGDPSLRHIANLATSAKSYPVDVARAHEFGADYYPTKPYDIQVLLQYAARQGWGHRTWKDALESAQEADVTQLDLFHHDPGHDDATRWTGPYLLPESTWTNVACTLTVLLRRTICWYGYKL